MEGPSAVCGVRKDGGDDVDQTTGALVQAAVSPSVQPGISIEGGPGVGRVTRPGLDQPVGVRGHQPGSPADDPGAGGVPLPSDGI